MQKNIATMLIDKIKPDFPIKIKQSKNKTGVIIKLQFKKRAVTKRAEEQIEKVLSKCENIKKPKKNKR